MVVARVDLFVSQLVFLFFGWQISELRPHGPLHKLPLPQLSNMPVAVQNCSFFRWDLSQLMPRPCHMVLSCPRLPAITLLCACRSESSSSAVQMVLSSSSPFLLAWHSFSVVLSPLAHPFSRYLLNPFWLPNNVLTPQDREGEPGSLQSPRLDILVGEIDHKPINSVSAGDSCCEASPRFLLGSIV